ncbi:MAG: hypothetical protein WC384_16175 [Prolixibacteraceae bacterium]
MDSLFLDKPIPNSTMIIRQFVILFLLFSGSRLNLLALQYTGPVYTSGTEN